MVGVLLLRALAHKEFSAAMLQDNICRCSIDGHVGRIRQGCPNLVGNKRAVQSQRAAELSPRILAKYKRQKIC